MCKKGPCFCWQGGINLDLLDFLCNPLESYFTEAFLLDSKEISYQVELIRNCKYCS